MINNLGFKGFVTIPLYKSPTSPMGEQKTITIDTKNLVLKEFSAKNGVSNPNVNIETKSGELIRNCEMNLDQVKNILGIKSKNIEPDIF